jgi:hypothetical protein
MKILAILLLSSLMTQSVYAHYTLGRQGSSGPTAPMGSTVNTLPNTHYIGDSHKPGHVAYAVPGSLYQPVAMQGNYYSPDGAVITGTSGDMNFYLNISSTDNSSQWVDVEWETAGYKGKAIIICIPPEFEVPGDWAKHDHSYITTSITNDYWFIYTGKFRDNHPYAPNWWYIKIWQPDMEHPNPPAGTGDLGATSTSFSSKYLYPAFEDPWQDRQLRTGPFAGCYMITVHGLKAPDIAGKYFFKILQTRDWYGSRWERFNSWAAENYPAVVVKADVDPAYIAGRVVYCAHTAYYYGLYYGDGVQVPGKVVAEGTTPDGRHVIGMAYFNSTANGYFEIEGLAPGTYTVTACAMGMQPYTLPQEITVHAGQSKHVTICVQPSFKFLIEVNSKCPAGPIPFPDYVALQWAVDKSYLSDVNASAFMGYPWGYSYFEIIDEEGEVIGWKEHYWDLTTNPQRFEALIGDPNCYFGAWTQWDGHIPDENATWVCGITPGVYDLRVNIFGYVQVQQLQIVVPETEHPGGMIRAWVDLEKGGTVKMQVHFHDFDLPSPTNNPKTYGVLVVEAYNQEGELVAYNLTRIRDTTTFTPVPDNINLTLIGYIQMIQDQGAGNWWMGSKKPGAAGMPEEMYTFKAWYNGYVQVEDIVHTVSYCSNSSFSMNLVKGANLTFSVYSRDCEDPQQPRDWTHPGNPLRVEIYDSEGALIGYTRFPGPKDGSPSGQGIGTLLVQKLNTDEVTTNFWGWERTDTEYLRGFKNRPLGLDSGEYRFEVYTVGYVMGIMPPVYAERGTNTTADIPLYVYISGDITVWMDFKFEMIPTPLLPDFWSYYFRLLLYDAEGNLVAANITAVPQASTYSVSQWPWANSLNPAQPGGVVSWKAKLHGFNTFSTATNHVPSVDGKNGFWATGGTPAGDLRKRFGYEVSFTIWSGGGHFTSDYRDYGIPPGTYTLVVEEDTQGGPIVNKARYVQLAEVTVTVTCAGSHDIILELDQAPLIGGQVFTRNFMQDFRNASWITMTVGETQQTQSVEDGWYSLYLPTPGTTLLTAELVPGTDVGYIGQSKEISTVWGATNTGNNFWLEESGIPIPEFSAPIFALTILAMFVALMLLYSKKRII